MRADSSRPTESSSLLRKEPYQETKSEDRKFISCALLLGGLFCVLLFFLLGRHSFHGYRSPLLHSQKSVRVYFEAVEQGVFLRINGREDGNFSVVGSDYVPWVAGSTLTLVEEDDGFCWKMKSPWNGMWIVMDGKLRASSISREEATCFEPLLMPSEDFPSVHEEGKAIPRLFSFRVVNTNEWLTLVHSGNSLDSPVTFTVSTTKDLNEVSVFRVHIAKGIKGVNLGGWFIPEVWMRPSFFEGTGLGWGGSLCAIRKYNQSLAEERIQHNLKTWIQEKDFVQIVELGFNSIRLPIGYWNVIQDPHDLYVPKNVEDSLQYIDWCFDMADRYNLSVLLDLHGGPGSQNGIDHSGCSMNPSWSSSKNVNMSLEAVKVMAARYSVRRSLLGFELLNEPSHDIEMFEHNTLESYYIDSYKIIREHSSTALVVFNELYKEFYSSWDKFAREPEFYNVVIDFHLYNWQEPYTSESSDMHVQDALDWAPMIRNYSLAHPILVGEWSMSTGTVVQAGQPFVNACTHSFSYALGHYAWNWKVEKNIGFNEWDVHYQAFHVNNGLRIY